MKRRTRLRLVTRASSTRFALPRALPVAKATPSLALEPRKLSGQTLRGNGHGLGVAMPLPRRLSGFECDVSRRFHLYPKGAALSEMMGKDAIRRIFDFI